MTPQRAEQLRAQAVAGRLSGGDLAEIQDAFAALDPARLADRPENATAVDMLEEILDDGTSGQDRESYTDDQDRDDYTVTEADGPQ